MAHALFRAENAPSSTVSALGVMAWPPPPSFGFVTITGLATTRQLAAGGYWTALSVFCHPR
jgi:hypothetical protein